MRKKTKILLLVIAAGQLTHTFSDYLDVYVYFLYALFSIQQHHIVKKKMRDYFALLLLQK